MEGLRSDLNWLEIWKSVRKKLSKCVIVEDLNFLEKDNSFSGSRSVMAFFKVLKKHFLCNLLLIFFWLEMQKVVTNCVKNIFLYPKFNFFWQKLSPWRLYKCCGMPRSVAVYIEVLQKTFFFNILLIFFWQETQKVVTKSISFIFEKYVIRIVNLWEEKQLWCRKKLFGQRFWIWWLYKWYNIIWNFGKYNIFSYGIFKFLMSSFEMFSLRIFD